MDIAVKWIVDILYVAIFVITVIVFAKRGFFESVFRFGRYIAAGLISYLVGPSVSGFISSKFIYNGIFNAVSNSVESFLNNTVGAVDLATLIDSLPFFIKQFVDPAALQEKYGATVDNFGVVADDFAASVATPLSNIISNLIAYALVYVVALLVLWILFKILNCVFELPILKTINVILGALLGIITAILMLAVLTWVLNLIMGIVGYESGFASAVSRSWLHEFFTNWELFDFWNVN